MFYSVYGYAHTLLTKVDFRLVYYGAVSSVNLSDAAPYSRGKAKSSLKHSRLANLTNFHKAVMEITI